MEPVIVEVNQLEKSPFNSPWSLRFERDVTDDLAIICDADNVELVRSRHFWLPEANDPEPPTLTAMRLIQSAPAMLETLRLAQQALNTAPRFRVCETDSYMIAATVDGAIAMATKPIPTARRRSKSPKPTTRRRCSHGRD